MACAEVVRNQNDGGTLDITCDRDSGKESGASITLACLARERDWYVGPMR